MAQVDVIETVKDPVCNMDVDPATHRTTTNMAARPIIFAVMVAARSLPPIPNII